jgi:hypothetical protein
MAHAQRRGCEEDLGAVQGGGKARPISKDHDGTARLSDNTSIFTVLNLGKSVSHFPAPVELELSSCSW